MFDWAMWAALACALVWMAALIEFGRTWRSLGQ